MSPNGGGEARSLEDTLAISKTLTLAMPRYLHPAMAPQVQIIGTAIGSPSRRSSALQDRRAMTEGKRLGECDVCDRIVESKARRFVRKYCSNVRNARCVKCGFGLAESETRSVDARGIVLTCQCSSCDRLP